MRYEDENIWLTQKMMATLYDVNVRTINEHIKKIYSDSELEEASTIRNFRIVQTEGSCQVARDTKHYNLQMIIVVGFKVNKAIYFLFPTHVEVPLTYGFPKNDEQSEEMIECNWLPRLYY